MFFGIALNNFGVRDLLDALAAFAPPPRGAGRRHAPGRGRTRTGITGFVFKIQANMDPKHRDRIAFVRVCSGKLTRGMKAKLVRTGKPISLIGAAVLLRAATAPSPRRPSPATSSASPTTARSASATR